MSTSIYILELYWIMVWTIL